MRHPRFALRALPAALLCAALAAPPMRAQTSAAGQWTWMGGSKTVSTEFGVWPGVYGTKDSPAPANIPPTRTLELTWTGADGRFWLFGGSNFTTGLNFFNDLWVFDPSSKQWTWMAGDNTVGSNCPVYSSTPYCGQPGVYGNLGASSPSNSPGARDSAVGWTDASGNLWLYGGLGVDSSGNFVELNDLWEFDISTAEWTWVAGDNTVPVNSHCSDCFPGIPLVSGKEGQPAPGNSPGGLFLGTSWTDPNGNFWLFGGWGEAPNSEPTVGNDLWEFGLSAGEWTWVGGSANFGDAGGVAGNYGTPKTPSAANFPGTRWQDATWVDASGDLWLFGGQGYDSTGSTEGVLNDLWKYDTATGEWAWMGGSSTFNCADFPQKYCNEPGVYGTRGQPSSTNFPGSRYLASNWIDSSGNFWLFGGDGFDSGDNWNYLNDLWKFDPPTNEWTWMSGTSNVTAGSVNGVYGTMGVSSAANVPGIRNGAASWTDKYGNLWLWGGSGVDSAGGYGYLNDLWEYQPASAAPPTTTATPAFSPGPGTYGPTQWVTITDSTSDASIYYTTDGTTPTAKSIQYSGPILVASTETIEAMATAPNDLPSAVASATYTIPADFTFALNPTFLAVRPGGSDTATITVHDEGGFNGNIEFACSGLPRDTACSFSGQTVPTPAGITYTTLTVTKTATTTARSGRLAPLVPASFLAATLCVFGRRKRLRMQTLLLVLCLAALGSFTGCVNPPLRLVESTSRVTLTAASGTLSHHTTFKLTVN